MVVLFYTLPLCENNVFCFDIGYIAILYHPKGIEASFIYLRRQTSKMVNKNEVKLIDARRVFL